MDEISQMISNMGSRSDKAQSLFSLGAGMASPVFGMASNIITQSMTDKYNREMALRAEQRQRDAEREAYSRAMHQQRIADAYNTPSAIMSRLREAGLNPLIAFNNGMSGNLSTGVPSAISPQVMPNSTSAPVDLDLFSAFATMQDTLNKNRELEIMASRAQYDNAKSDAEREGILKQNSFMDAVEHDRHAEANSRILNNAAQRELWFAQKDKLIEDALQAQRELIEDRRQFDVQMSFMRKQEKNKLLLRSYEMAHESALKQKEILANEKLSAATNDTWIKSTLSNSEWMKWKYARENGMSLEEIFRSNAYQGKYGTAAAVGGAAYDDFEGRRQRAYERSQESDNSRSGNKAKYKHQKDKLKHVSYSNSTGTNR